jgi:hypothetical protein
MFAIDFFTVSHMRFLSVFLQEFPKNQPHSALNTSVWPINISAALIRTHHRLPSVNLATLHQNELASVLKYAIYRFIYVRKFSYPSLSACYHHFQLADFGEISLKFD